MDTMVSMVKIIPLSDDNDTNEENVANGDNDANGESDTNDANGTNESPLAPMDRQCFH